MRSIASIAAVASLAVLGGVTTTRAAPAEPQGNQVMLGFWFDSADRKSYFYPYFECTVSLEGV